MSMIAIARDGIVAAAALVGPTPGGHGARLALSHRGPGARQGRRTGIAQRAPRAARAPLGHPSMTPAPRDFRSPAGGAGGVSRHNHKTEFTKGGTT